MSEKCIGNSSLQSHPDILFRKTFSILRDDKRQLAFRLQGDLSIDFAYLLWRNFSFGLYWGYFYSYSYVHAYIWYVYILFFLWGYKRCAL